MKKKTSGHHCQFLHAVFPSKHLLSNKIVVTNICTNKSTKISATSLNFKITTSLSVEVLTCNTVMFWECTITFYYLKESGKQSKLMPRQNTWTVIKLSQKKTLKATTSCAYQGWINARCNSYNSNLGSRVQIL